MSLFFFIKTALNLGWFDCRLDGGICQTIPNCIDNDAAVGIGLGNYTYGTEPPRGLMKSLRPDRLSPRRARDARLEDSLSGRRDFISPLGGSVPQV